MVIAVERLLKPRSIAIIGASDKPGALGASVLSNLERNDFSGEIHLVNPKRDKIGERDCLGGIEWLPKGIDVAVLAIPRDAVLDSIRQLAEREVGAAVIFSAGFSEAGGEGLAEQREIARIAAEAGMIALGPNCLGMVNHFDRVPLTFVETLTVPSDQTRRIGIVSQSGAMACVLAVTIASRGIAMSYSVSTGNEAASGVEDYVEYLVDDPNTSVIAMIVEQFRQPRRFLAAARKARQVGKTIVLLHPGKSAAARNSAITHTGAMAGDYQVMRVKCGHAGVAFAETLEELADTAEIALRCPLLPSGGTAILGESGAFKALCLDLCEEIELDLPRLADADSPALRAALPNIVGVSNPLDLTAQGLVDPSLYHRTIIALLDNDQFGCVVLGIIQTDDVTCRIKLPPILQALQDARSQKPVIFAGLDEGAVLPTGYLIALRDAGVPYFPTAERALRAVKRLNDLVVHEAENSTPEPLPLPNLPEPGVVPEYRAKQLLAPAGLSFPEGRFVTSLDEALAAADQIGYPLALKAQSPELSHKSDAGGVLLGIADRDQLAAAWRRMQDNMAVNRPGMALDGILLERMGDRGIELIIGARNDPDWGPVLLAGFGGITAEVTRDVRLMVPELTLDAIIHELHKLKSGALLKGFRGSPPLDSGVAASLIQTLGRIMLAEPRIREIDLNPVVIYPEGRGVAVLDALMLLN